VSQRALHRVERLGISRHSHPLFPVPASSYVLLGLSVFLLLFPRNWLRHGMRVTPKPPRKYNQAKVERDPYDRTVKPTVEAVKPRNWVDFFRAVVGGAVLSHVVEKEFGLIAESSTLFTIMCVGLAVAVFAQMVRLEGRLSLFAPIFYLQGLCVGFCGPVVGLFSTLGAWALSPVLPTAGALLFVQGMGTLCLGFLLKEEDPALATLIACVTLLPSVVSVLLHKRLTASFDKKLKIVPRDARSD
jgi:hypothetical protein